ncbi:MAG: AAA family ATPase, partial [Eubacteriales bacterium]|nr:AAA family ATPase [Eubacteriales bacterium]
MDTTNTSFCIYSDIKSISVDWLWYPYIPFGKITLLQGDPGGGKSTMMMDLIGKITTSRMLPDGRTIHPINVIYQCSEDGLADTIKPRLE